MARKADWKRKLSAMAQSSVEQLVNAGTEHIAVALATDNEGDLVVCTFDAREGWAAKRPRLLANSVNPHGYASVLEVIEQLLDELHEELAKCHGQGVPQ